MRIAFFELEPWEKEYIQSNNLLSGLDAELVFFDHYLDKHNIPSDTKFDAISMFIGSTIDDEVLGKFPNLKFIAVRATGYDNAAPQECTKRNILVANVPTYGENTVAEYTFALILALLRKVYDSYDQVRTTGSFSLKNLRGTDLKGKTLGVVGVGNIGKHVIRIAKGFEMNVVAYDVRPSDSLASDLGFVYGELDEVLRRSDILSLHVPYMKATHYLINKDALAKMKKGAVIINTSRGPVIDTEALVASLKMGNLGGAALDVLEEEGFIRDELELLIKGHPEEHNLKKVLVNHLLIDMPNVIITPHNAFNTWEALKRILDTTAENIAAFVGGKPKNLV